MTKRVLLYGVCSALFVAQAAHAQSSTTTPAAPGVTGLSEVVVTAQRREERLQDVPVAVTAFPTQTLVTRQIADVRSITRFAPTMSYATAPSDPTDVELGIRGIVTPDAMLIGDLAVPVYVDGIYIARSTGTNAAFVDMERVEVLRGPQGTLFGRNTTGGALSVTTQKPTDRFEGMVEAGAGNYASRTFEGVVNAPLAPQAAVRLVYQHDEHGPFGHSLVTGAGLDSVNSDYVRGGLRYDFNPDWQMLISADYLKATGDGSATRLGYYSPTLTLAPGLPPLNQMVPAVQGHPGDLLTNYANLGGFHDNYSDFDGRYRIRTYSTTATLTGKIGEVNVKSITGYRDVNAPRPVDYDGVPYGLQNVIKQPLTQHQFSEEFQVYGDTFDSRLNYIAGLYYFREAGRQGADTVLFGNQVDSVLDYNATNISLGAFAQVTYDLTSNLKLTGGVRYTKDIRKVNYHDGVRDLGTGAFTCTLNPAVRVGAGCDAPGERRFQYVPFTVGIDYKPNEDVLLYAKVSKGFRSGGFPQSTNNSLPFLTSVAPENVVSPEAGAKLTLLNRRLILNSAIFYSKYGQIQQLVASVVNGFPAQLQLNVGDAEIYGGEVEATALIGDLRLTSALGLIHPKYTKGPSVGEPFLYASKQTVSIAADYEIRTDFGKVILSGDYSYRSKIWFQSPVTGIAAVDDVIKQKGYGLLGARASVEIGDTGVTAAVFGRNLTNVNYKTRALDFVASTGEAVYYPGDPRTYGVSLSYRF